MCVWRKGDQERELKLPISFGCDRLNPMPLDKFQVMCTCVLVHVYACIYLRVRACVYMRVRASTCVCMSVRAASPDVNGIFANIQLKTAHSPHSLTPSLHPSLLPCLAGRVYCRRGATVVRSFQSDLWHSNARASGIHQAKRI